MNKEAIKIFITGASKGIGQYLLGALMRDGFDVCGTYHNSLPPKHLESLYTHVDISDSEQIAMWAKKETDGGKKIVLINNAGVNYNAFAHKSDIVHWTNVIDVNISGTFRVIQTFLPYMREMNFGRIINISSIVSKMGVIGTSAYASSKAALSGLSKSIAVENASKCITINNLELGYFEIGMINEIPPEQLKKIKETIPSRKLGEPLNIVKAINFLIEADYVNGSCIDINGGLY